MLFIAITAILLIFRQPLIDILTGKRSIKKTWKEAQDLWQNLKEKNREELIETFKNVLAKTYVKRFGLVDKLAKYLATIFLAINGSNYK